MAASDADARQVLRSNLWPTGTRVMLLSVPWDSAYRDVVAWESAEARDAWFAAQTDVAWTDVTFNYLWPNQPVAVPVPFSTAYRYNYIAVTNPAQPVTDEGPVRTYYYFITDVQYLSPQASNLMVQLDVMTTYAEHITFGKAFVDRGHIAMANSNVGGELAFTGEQLNDYLTLPEGLDVGSNYVIADQSVVNLQSESPWIVIISAADLEHDPGTTSSPNLSTATGFAADDIPCGCEVYCMKPDHLISFMTKLSNKSWVSQCILCMYAFPGELLHEGVASRFLGDTVDWFFKLGSTDDLTPESSPIHSVNDAFSELRGGLGDYSDVKKLYTYPYSVIELTSWTGNNVFLKPQLLQGRGLQLYAMTCALMPFARIAAFVRNYGGPRAGTSQITYSYFSPAGGEKDAFIPAGDFLDSALWLTDFPQYAIVNNQYFNVLASTANTRAYNYQSAGWLLDRANMIAENQYGNATLGNINAAVGTFMNTGAAQANAERTRNAGLLSNGVTAAAAVPGVVMTAGILGTTEMAGALAGVNQTVTNYTNAMNSAGTSQVTSLLDAAANQLAADANRKLAEQVNSGDYANRVAGINAQVQDAALTPPSVVGQMGGNGFNWKNGLFSICIRWKTIAGSSLAAVGDYFRRYGYAVRRWLNLGSLYHMLCMSKFAYWRVLESNITCAWANESERETMRGIIEKGVTLWDAPESIGNTDLAANEAKDGYSY